MPMHVVEQGEYLSGIAKENGFSDWRTIYNHPQNADLRKNRPNPNILLPGDLVFIPELTLRQHPGAVDQRHNFEVKKTALALNIVLKDAENNPIANQPYTLTIGWDSVDGQTDGDGLLQQTIPIGTTSAVLKLEQLGLTWNLKIGHLDPLREDDSGDAIISGVQARLNNLGFFCGQVDGIVGPKTTAGVQMYQESVMGRKNPDGKLDGGTIQSIIKEYGC